MPHSSSGKRALLGTRASAHLFGLACSCFLALLLWGDPRAQAQVVLGSQDFTIVVAVPEEPLTADLVGPETALQGASASTAWLQGLYDGDTSTAVFSSVGTEARLRFAAPVLTSGAHIEVSSSLYTRDVFVDALLDGAWVQVWTAVVGGNGSRSGYFAFPSGAVATTELRIRSTLASGTGVSLREFRAGHNGTAPIGAP